MSRAGSGHECFPKTFFAARGCRSGSIRTNRGGTDSAGGRTLSFTLSRRPSLPRTRRLTKRDRLDHRRHLGEVASWCSPQDAALEQFRYPSNSSPPGSHGFHAATVSLILAAATPPLRAPARRFAPEAPCAACRRRRARRLRCRRCRWAPVRICGPGESLQIPGGG